jgi:hypothetical protein
MEIHVNIPLLKDLYHIDLSYYVIFTGIDKTRDKWIYDELKTMLHLEKLPYLLPHDKYLQYKDIRNLYHTSKNFKGAERLLEKMMKKFDNYYPYKLGGIYHQKLILPEACRRRNFHEK